MRPREPRVAISVFLFLFALLVLTGCSKSAPPAAMAGGPPGAGPAGGGMPATPVTVAKATTTSVPVELHAVGNVEAFSTIQVKSQVSGTLVAVRFTEGQDVRKGQLLFEIDSRPFEEAIKQVQANIAKDRAQLAQAEANLSRDQAQLANTEVQARRYAELAREGIVSKEQNESYATNAGVQREALKADQAGIAQAQAAITADQASLSAAQLNLDYCKIYSPLNGRTGNLIAKEGNLVKAQADQALVTINQFEPVYVDFSVPESQLAAIRQFSAKGKLPVQATIGQDPIPAAGELAFIDNTVNTATGTILLKATFANRDHRLWPGQFVNTILRLAMNHDVVVVPSEVVQTGQQGTFGYVISAKGTAEMRPLVIGQTYNGQTVIEKGIAAGETVVTDGQMMLGPGAPVRIVKGAGQ
jgi:multidrug efflux system membrane fusion protein